MKKYINIKGNNQSFPYLFEYNENDINNITNHNIVWCEDLGTVRFYGNGITHYRDINDWYKYTDKTLESFNFSDKYVPKVVNTSTIKMYIPSHSISSYSKGVKYIVSCNTWISGKKIDLGSFLFDPTDTRAAELGVIKNGNFEYYEYVQFDIIDPFYLIYTDKEGEDDWVEFRNKICGEHKYTNTTCSYLNISLFVVDEYDNSYILNNDWLGGVTSFNVSSLSDYLAVNLQFDPSSCGFGFGVNFNEVYEDDLLGYLKETYFNESFDINENDIIFELIIKNKDSLIIGPKLTYSNIESKKENIDKKYNIYQVMNNYFIKSQKIDEYGIDRSGVSLFFNNWNVFEEGWSVSGSMSVINRINDKEYEELFHITSNELPITQELFSKFVNDKYEKIIDIKDMNITTYNIVNKIENKIVTLDRQNESKNNIIQPVFFRVTELEKLIIYPHVTENISINLDKYKSKVNKFILQINNCRFEQIGANSYGILFKIPANTLPVMASTGVYYILNENMELITTGKFTCIV